VGGNRSTRSAKQLPTKEMFFTFASLGGGATLTFVGGFAGVLIDADDEAAYISLFVPHDFRALKSLKLLVIPIAANAAMTLRSICNFAHNEEVYNTHEKTVDDSFIAGTNVLHEIDVTDLLDTLVVPLDNNDYVGIKVTRIAGQNTNALIVGVKLRYN